MILHEKYHENKIFTDEDGLLIQLIKQVDKLANNNNRPSQSDLYDLENSWEVIKMKLRFGRFYFIDNNEYYLFQVNKLIIENIIDYVKLNDPNFVQDSFLNQKKYDSCFAQSDEIKASEFGDCIGNFKITPWPDVYNNVKVKQISTDSDMRAEFTKLQYFLLLIKENIKELNETKFITLIGS